MSATKQAKGHAFELIPISIEAKGEVLDSNLSEFREMVREVISGINLTPETDEEFGQAEADIKALKYGEEAVEKAKAEFLQQMESVNAVLETLNETGGEIRDPRLGLEKAVKSQKEIIRQQIKRDALASISMAHPKAETRVIEAMKGKRTLETLRSAAKEEAAKIESEIQAVLTVVKEYTDKHGEDLGYDAHLLIGKTADEARGEMERRLERRRAEAEKARLKAEADKARAEAAEAAKPQTPSQKAGLPDAPKVSAIPVGRKREETAGEEMDRFIETLKIAFAPVKEARAALKHEANIEAAAEFAATLGEAWKKLREKGGSDE